MYKTVRHGENSLQYTILPQQDDAAIMTATNSVCGRSVAGVRRGARRGRITTILILTLILACGVIGAVALVHLLISTDLVSLPSALQRFRTNNNVDHHGGRHSSHSMVPQGNKTTPVRQNTTPLSSFVSEDAPTSSSVKFDQSSTSVGPPPLSEVVMGTTTERVEVVATSTEGALTTPVEVGGRLEEDVGAKEHDHFGSSKKKALNEDARNTTTRVFVSSATGEDKGVLVLDVGRSTERPKHRSWLEPRWSFADPSSYLHWVVSTCFGTAP